jgi:hypothetical protein
MIDFVHTERHKCLATLWDIRIIYGDGSLLRGLNMCHLGGVWRTTSVLKFDDCLGYRGVVKLAGVLHQASYQQEKRRFAVVGINGCAFKRELARRNNVPPSPQFRGQTIFRSARYEV